MNRKERRERYPDRKSVWLRGSTVRAMNMYRKHAVQAGPYSDPALIDLMIKSAVLGVPLPTGSVELSRQEIIAITGFDRDDYESENIENADDAKEENTTPTE